MKITESKIRNMIRSELKKLREASTSATGTGGAEKKGFQSKERNTSQSDYNIKSADYKTKTTDYEQAVRNVDTSKRFRKLIPPKKR